MQRSNRLTIFSIILFLAAFTPYQKLLQTFLSPLGMIASLILVSVESILFVLFLVFLVVKIWAGERLARTPLDLPILLFLGVTLVSTVINHQFTAGAFNGLRVVVRYIPLYFIIVNLNISAREIGWVQKIIVYTGIFSGALAVVLFFVPSLNRLIAPRAIEFGDFSKNAAAVKVGAVTGTFSVPAETASFLLLALIVFLVYVRVGQGWYNWVSVRLGGAGLIIFGIFATYLRAALLLVPVVFGLYLWYHPTTQRRKSWLALLCLVMFLFIDLAPVILGENSILADEFAAYTSPVREYDYYQKGVNVTQFFTQLVSRSYWQHILTHQRGWTIVVVGGHMLTSGKVFGYGPDPGLTRKAIGSQSVELSYVFLYPTFRDAYWIALMTSFGVIGLGLFLWIMYLVYQVSTWLIRDGHLLHQQLLGLLVTVYIIVFFLYSFALPLPEIKAPSFFFWLLSGLVMNQYLANKKHPNQDLMDVQINDA